MQQLEKLKSSYRYLVLINGLLPIIVIGIVYALTATLSFPLGYLLYGWSELLGLTTFVAVVPDVASWFLFGLKVVGAEATAHLSVNLIILLGSIAIIIGCLQSTQKVQGDEAVKGRMAWLIGGLLTFPLGLLTIYAFIVTRPKERDISMKDAFIGELQKNKLPYILMIPFIVFLIFTYIIPIFRGFYITLFAYPENDLSRAFIGVDYSNDPLLWTIHAILGGLQKQDPIFVSVENFLELFSQTTRATSFQNALDNNIYFVIIFVPAVVITALLLAVLLNSKLLKGENAYTTIFYLPVVTSILVAAVIWGRVVFEPRSGLLSLLFTLAKPLIDGAYGLLSAITFGIIPANTVGTNINWISNYLMESITIMSVWRRVGFDVLILLAGLKSIPASLYEAADIDGHGGWSKFKNITLPMLKGPLGVVIILELINGWLVFQELYGLNVAQFGGDHTLAVYLIANYASPPVMTFASTVGYFIFAMTAYFSILGRVEFRNVLKGFSMFIILAVMFSIPTNRQNTTARSLGFNIDWLTYDVAFLALSFVCLLYYVVVVLYKRKQLEEDIGNLKITGMLVLFVSPFYLLNGYNTLTQSGFGSTPIWFIPSLFIGIFLLVTGLMMLLARYYVPFIKERGWLSFLFPATNAEQAGGEPA